MKKMNFNKFIKKAAIVFCLFFIPVAFSYSQPENSVCKSHIANIFKVLDLKKKYEAAVYLSQIAFRASREGRELPGWIFNSCEIINSGISPNLKKQYDSILVKEKRIEWMSEDEMNDYHIEKWNCSSGRIYDEYRYFIQNIKSEKEIYLKCLDMELAKGDLSEYAKDPPMLYKFMEPMSSLRPVSITKLSFLKIFKEFIFNDNEDVLPESEFILYMYLNCNCKIKNMMIL